MLDLKHERSIPIDGSSDETVQNLALLFPATAKDSSKNSGEIVKAFAAGEAQEAASSLAPIRYEETGSIIVTGCRDDADRLVLHWAQELVALTASGRPILKSHVPSLRLYYLWRTFRFSCGRIEALNLHPRSNLPAIIVELVERFGLPYHRGQFQDLQRMALVQFHTRQKLASLEDVFRGSRFQGLSLTDLHEHVTGLMTVIRGKIAAEDWINAAPERSQEPNRDLLPFAMWHISQVSADNISRLLLIPEHNIAESILEEVLRVKTPATFSKSALENLAQSTNYPLLWTNRLLTDAKSTPQEAHEPEIMARECTSIMKQEKSAQLPELPLVVLSGSRQHEGVATKGPEPALSKTVDSPKRLDPPNDVRNQLTARTARKTKNPEPALSKTVRVPKRLDSPNDTQCHLIANTGGSRIIRKTANTMPRRSRTTPQRRNRGLMHGDDGRPR
jgi:hypothetical protein